MTTRDEVEEIMRKSMLAELPMENTDRTRVYNFSLNNRESTLQMIIDQISSDLTVPTNAPPCHAFYLKLASFERK